MDEQGHREAAARIIDPKVMRWAADLCLRAGPAEAARQYGPRRNRALAKADAILALSALPIQGGGWRPIEEAPRDGTRFLAYGGGLEAVEACYWSEPVCCWSCESVTLDDTDNEPDGYHRPTVWRPLPAPPVHAEETK